MRSVEGPGFGSAGGCAVAASLLRGKKMDRAQWHASPGNVVEFLVVLGPQVEQLLSASWCPRS